MKTFQTFKRLFCYFVKCLFCGNIAIHLYEHFATFWVSRGVGGELFSHIFGIYLAVWIGYELMTGKLLGSEHLTEK